MEATAQKTVLIIEDEPALLEAAKLKLEMAGFRALAAPTAEEGLKLLEQDIPDLIWLDMLLPEMNGFQFLEALRKKEEWRNVPVLVVSVSEGPEKMQRALGLNVVDVLVKSEYRLEDIVNRINAVLRRGTVLA